LTNVTFFGIITLIKQQKEIKMSYAIYYDFSEKIEGKDYVNLTWDLINRDKTCLIDTEQFKHFYEGCEVKDKLSAVNEFKSSYEYYSFEESFIPINCYVHILQYDDMISDEQIKLVNKYAKNCVIVYIKELDVYGIALTAVGMDLRSEIELAYYIIDGVSPVIVNQIDLSDKATKLLEYCKSVVKKEGWISFSKIEEFLER